MQFTNGYKAIIFDLDGTLRHTVPLGSDVFTNKARELGLEVNDAQEREAGRWEHYYWARSDELREDVENYEDDENAFWVNYANRRLNALGASPMEVQKYAMLIHTHMRDEYKGEDFVPPELHEVLPILQKAGLKLGVLSNRRRPFMDRMEKLELADYFEIIRAAGEIGSWKPNPQVFTPLLEYFNVAPPDTIYIGDNYYADVIGARAAGIEPVLYDPRGIFPDADCTRITSFLQLIEIL